MSFSRPSNLPSLTPREAVADALQRVLMAFDRNDKEMFESAFSGEVVLEIRDGGLPDATYDLASLREELLNFIGSLDTTHMISNMRVYLEDNATSASMSAFVLATHCPRGRGKDAKGPKYTVAEDHLIDLEKSYQDGLWKIKKWDLDVIWRNGDGTIMYRS